MLNVAMVINGSDLNQGVSFIFKGSECEMVQLKVEERYILMGWISHHKWRYRLIQ